MHNTNNLQTNVKLILKPKPAYYVVPLFYQVVVHKILTDNYQKTCLLGLPVALYGNIYTSVLIEPCDVHHLSHQKTISLESNKVSTISI